MSAILEEKERKYGIEFPTATLQTDLVELTIPPGYVPDELPPPLKIDYDFATYSSKVEMIGSNVLRYTRSYQVRDVMIPPARLGDLKKFFHQILTDEANSAVLKKSGA